MKIIIALTLALTLSGCSGFKLGAFCYLPSGPDVAAGSCTIMTVPTPTKSAEAAKI